jgi:hypothetical protein
MHILLFSVQTYYELRKNASAQNEMWITLLLAADWRDCLKKKSANPAASAIPSIVSPQHSRGIFRWQFF